MTVRRFARTAVAVAAAAGLAGCAPSPLWTQSLGNAGHTGSNPAETALSSQSVGTLHPTWSVPSNTSSAVVDGTTLFDAEGIDDRNLVVARDLVTGKPRWSTAVPAGRALWGSAFAADGGSYAAGRYYAGPQVLDAATGRVLFLYDIQTFPPAATEVRGPARSWRAATT